MSGFAGLTVAAFESRMADDMARLITRYGGHPVVAPAMRELPLENNAEALAFGGRLLAGEIDALILLTGAGTTALIDLLATHHPRHAITAALARTCLVARGPKPVAALKALGLSPTITVPEPNTWRDILQALGAGKPTRGLRIAVQEYGVVNEDLLRGLRDRGADVTRVPIYRWALPDDLEPLRDVLRRTQAGEVDVLLITNAAQVEHVTRLLVQDGDEHLFRQALARMVVASIGPTASERLHVHAWPVDVEPSHPKMGTLVKETSERARALLQKKRSA
ncbi:MAG: uroporphyrinogen-III synthase [Nitrospiraceae bacterium]